MLAALFIGFAVYWELDLKVLHSAIVEASTQTAVPMLLVAAPDRPVLSLIARCQI